MTEARFDLHGGTIVLARVSRTEVALAVWVVTDAGDSALAMYTEAPAHQCAVGHGFHPWREDVPTVRVGHLAMALTDDESLAMAERVIRGEVLQ